MPVLSVTTNVTLEPASSDTIIRQLSSEVAIMLGKPESYVMVIMRHEPLMAFAASTEPCAYLELKSIGLPEEQTTDFSALLCDQLETLLKIPANRIYIEFSNARRNLFGWDRRTF